MSVMGFIMCGNCGETWDKNDSAGHEAHLPCETETQRIVRLQGEISRLELENTNLRVNAAREADEQARKLYADGLASVEANLLASIRQVESERDVLRAGRDALRADVATLLAVVAPRCRLCLRSATKYLGRPSNGDAALAYGCDDHAKRAVTEDCEMCKGGGVTYGADGGMYDCTACGRSGKTPIANARWSDLPAAAAIRRLEAATKGGAT